MSILPPSPSLSLSLASSHLGSALPFFFHISLPLAPFLISLPPLLSLSRGPTLPLKSVEDLAKRCELHRAAGPKPRAERGRRTVKNTRMVSDSGAEEV